jgi:uncharacterized small protein (DUF1192 family)
MNEKQKSYGQIASDACGKGGTTFDDIAEAVRQAVLEREGGLNKAIPELITKIASLKAELADTDAKLHGTLDALDAVRILFKDREAKLTEKDREIERFKAERDGMKPKEMPTDTEWRMLEVGEGRVEGDVLIEVDGEEVPWSPIEHSNTQPPNGYPARRRIKP